MKKLTVAFAGLGSRGTTYASILADMPSQVEIVAAADLDEAKLTRFAEKYGVPPERRYHSAEEMLREDRLADAMVIATWDRAHAENAVNAMRKGYQLLLEKPISPFLNECLQVDRAATETGREAVVCHVLRFAPFFRKIRQTILSGAIGEVVAIQMIEKVRYWHQAHSFVRGNWRNSEETSPMILQKSCHDMDILLWLTGKHCEKVSSFGSLRYFKPEFAPEGAPERCTEACPQYHTCPYGIENCYLRRAREEQFFGWPTDVVTQEGTLEALEAALRDGPYGRCVFHCDNDVVDHQVVNLLLEDGVTASFTMCAFTSEGGRRIHVMGTAGDIVGELEENRITVTRFGQEPQELDASLPDGDNVGHGGGDQLLAEDFVRLLLEDGSREAVTNIHNSVESHVVALAAEESRVNGGTTIDIKEFVNRASE